MRALLIGFCCFLIPLSADASRKMVNVYMWPGVIPDAIVQQFEKETGIKVNISNFENNEIMYAKLHSTQNAGYDVINPSSYFVDRMRQEKMLEKLDKRLLPNLSNLDPTFLNPTYDPDSQYSVANIWGVTGIFVNKHYYSPQQLAHWKDLWDKQFDNQLMLLDDTREVFSMALISLGYPANDPNPDHIREAFIKLKALMKNVKVFSSDTTTSIMIDEDATVGMAWNGDAYKAWLENPAVQFVLPKEGFVVWVDTLCIPATAPHKDTAYAFINYMLRPDVAKAVAVNTHFPTPNAQAQKLLPASTRDNPTVYPPKEVMRRGQFQTNLSKETLALYEQYWDELKMSG